MHGCYEFLDFHLVENYVAALGPFIKWFVCLDGNVEMLLLVCVLFDLDGIYIAIGVSVIGVKKYASTRWEVESWWRYGSTP